MKYARNCLGCIAPFETNYWNKKYCGSESCEKIRQSVKNKTAQKKREVLPLYREKTRQNYLRNRKNILERKKQKYREKYNVVSGNFRDYRTALKPPLESKTITQQERNSQRLSYKEVKSLIEQRGYILLSKTYQNNYSKLAIICPEGHRTETCFMSFSKGHGCSECAKHFTQSNAERQIAKKLCEMKSDLIVIHNFKLFGDKQEVDLYFPEQKVAVEYCGLHWHKESMLESRISKKANPRKYHREKMDKCIQKGVRLITIFEDEYLNFPDVVISRIAHSLKLYPDLLYGRNCTIRLLDAWEAAEFLDQYHLQGSSGSVFWGLEYNNRLVQVLSAGSLSRAHAANGHKIIELKRLASLPFLSVVGGFSKLLKAFIDYARSEGYFAIKSYADMRYADPFNTVYGKVGFKLVAETAYSPHYIRGKKRYRNQTLRKPPREKLTGKTEWELRRQQGFDRIWDCGHRTYVYYL